MLYSGSPGSRRRTGPDGPIGPQGPAGAVLNFADFYALMPPDNAATANSILTVRNPAGNTAALGITPLAGGKRPVSAHLVIAQLQ